MHAAAGVYPLGGIRRTIPGILLALAVAGCASTQERSGEPSGEGAGEVRAGAAPGKLHVTNRNWLDMRIYALRGSERITLLTLTSMRADSVPLPRSLLTGTGFRLVADPVGGDPYRSSTIYLRPGQTVWWRLENVLDQSSLWVY